MPEEMGKNVISLPVYPEFKEEERDEVIRVIALWDKNNS
tara:strand:+ start:142 stop:258 length:117 start_codon:yes stop_codon:yes gene_type:complete